MRQFAIVRFFNYADADLAKAQKVADYIQSPKRTRPELVLSHGLAAGDVTGSFKAIEERWHPKGHRLFKHGVFSFGCPDLTPEKAVDATKAVMAAYHQYPWLATIHVNCLQRVHAHFLLGCIDLHTGKKLSQSPKDLKRFKEFYNEAVAPFGLPPVRGTPPLSPPDGRESDEAAGASGDECLFWEGPGGNAFLPSVAEEHSPFVPMPAPDPFADRYAGAASAMAAWHARTTFNTYRDDFAKFFLLGYGKEDD